ncbi:protease FtsH-inhibitory lysogeny factor CIII [Erwinia sp. PK3-005]|nr:protease FtsH-inhibitory lysogeny factor CIII [Mixta calida]MDU4288372.1 protease FtsH-inhibitory lysogeny factor CIII [Mixta calida]
MQLAFAGQPVAGCSESLLELITRRLRTGWRNLFSLNGSHL